MNFFEWEGLDFTYGFILESNYSKIGEERKTTRLIVQL